MSNKLRALVVSQDDHVMRHIEAAFETAPDIEVALGNSRSAMFHDGWSPNVLIVHGESPDVALRQLRQEGYKQPALILTDESQNARAAALEPDLSPLENVTWAVMRAGGLPSCVTMLMSTVPC